jgi:ribonuclease Y
MNDYSILIGIGCFFAGLLIAYWIKSRIMTQKIKAAEGEAVRFAEDSRKKAEALLREADLEVKDRLFKLKS